MSQTSRPMLILFLLEKKPKQNKGKKQTRKSCPNIRMSMDDLQRRRNRIRTSISEKDSRQHRYVLS